jgi:hypothetical protein
MTRYHLFVLLLIVLLVTAGCEQTSIAQQEQIRSLETLQASTPSVTPTPTTTPTPTPTLSPTPTTGPSPTPTATPTPTVTPVPSPTPLPPTATPDPAVAQFSLCNQTAGDLNSGRFSAQVEAITTTVEAAFERVTVGLRVPADSSPPHATARCLSAADDPARGELAGGSAYMLLLDFEDWLHDDAFSASTVTRTVALSGTTALKNISYQFDPNAPAGATLVIGLEQPLPYRLALETNPYRLVLEVAKAPGQTTDMLATASGDAQPSAPIVYLQEGDIWSFDGGNATNLTDSPEVETALAVDPGAGQIAFCRAAPGADVGDALAPSELWIMGIDGSDPNQLAAPGRTCIDPVFSPDGSLVAFGVDETGAIPARLSIWAVSVADGDTRQLTSTSDEWSRFGAQWLDNGRLVYSAVSEDGRNTLFLLDSASGVEQDIGAELVRGNRYRALGRPLAAPGGGVIAIEALRADAEGADMVLLDATGAVSNTIGGSFWTRPLAWGEDGRLFYLTSTCPSEVAHDYTLHARATNGNDQLLATGRTLGGFGHFAALNGGLAYVTLAHPAPGPRGPLALDRASPSALWFWDISGGKRSMLVESQSAISGLGL